MRSRVMPGSSPTMERRVRVSRLKSVDLPTFGRPTIATKGHRSSADDTLRRLPLFDLFFGKPALVPVFIGVIEAVSYMPFFSNTAHEPRFVAGLTLGVTKFLYFMRPLRGWKSSVLPYYRKRTME